MLRITYFTIGVMISAACIFVLRPDRDAGFEKAYSARVAGTTDHSDSIAKGAQRADDGLFYVDGHANGQTVKFLVDTGASYIVLSHRDATKLAVTRLDGADRTHLQTAAGLARVDWVKIPELHVNGRILREIRAAVPRHDVGISLLGQNALAQFHAIHITGDRLNLLY
jgi:aspartyl protease family protein